MLTTGCRVRGVVRRRNRACADRRFKAAMWDGKLLNIAPEQTKKLGNDREVLGADTGGHLAWVFEKRRFGPLRVFFGGGMQLADSNTGRSSNVRDRAVSASNDRIADMDPVRVEMRARALKARAELLRSAPDRRRSGTGLVLATLTMAGTEDFAPRDGAAGAARHAPAALAVKRAFDIVGSLMGLVLLAPLLIVVAILIKMESAGPVCFRQSRTGLDNEPFEILKFRSMYTDRGDPSGVAQTTSDDPRITPLGRMLRRTNLDELPQLINVLKGDMSLIGPRPHVPGMMAAGMVYEDLVDDYPLRHKMRPGITGLAQCHGYRGPTTQPEPAAIRVALDLDYISRFSLWLDFKILARTIVSELQGGKGF